MNAMTGRSKSYLIGVLVAYTAVVLVQAMYFKFTNSVETQLVFGTLSDCVESAVTGRVSRKEGLWRES